MKHKEITLPNGVKVLVDNGDYPKVKDYKLYVFAGKCIAAYIKKGEYKMIHHFLFDLKDDEKVVYLNGNYADNRRSNVIVTKKRKKLL